MWSSYLDKEIWLISQSFCVSARDEMGCHSEFSKMLCKFVCCDSSPGCTGLGTLGGRFQYV